MICTEAQVGGTDPAVSLVILVLHSYLWRVSQSFYLELLWSELGSAWWFYGGRLGLRLGSVVLLLPAHMGRDYSPLPAAQQLRVDQLATHNCLGPALLPSSTGSLVRAATSMTLFFSVAGWAIKLALNPCRTKTCKRCDSVAVGGPLGQKST